MHQENKLRDLFLSSFVEVLIKNSYTQPENPNKSNQPAQVSTAVQLSPPQVQFQIPKPQVQLKPQTMPQLPPKPTVNALKAPPNFPTKSSIPLPQRLPQAIVDSKGKIINLGKISSILGDPSVFSVESPGPNKNLIVNRAGKVQTSTLKLNKEEIDLVMKEISDKTRIPLISGGVLEQQLKIL